MGGKLAALGAWVRFAGFRFVQHGGTHILFRLHFRSRTKGISILFSFNPMVVHLMLFFLLQIYLTRFLLHIESVPFYLYAHCHLNLKYQTYFYIILASIYFTIQHRTRVLDLFASVAESPRISKHFSH